MSRVRNLQQPTSLAVERLAVVLDRSPLTAAADPRLPPPPSRLPHARQLAALGTVLCLFRPRHGGELGGWAQAVRVLAAVDGPDESLDFLDRHGRCCWRLFLLPDSDFLAWDTLLAQLPSQPPGRVVPRFWRRLASRLEGGWRACALQLHALPPTDGTVRLAASPAPVSRIGAVAARRVARQHGACGQVQLDATDAVDGRGHALTVPTHVPLPRLQGALADADVWPAVHTSLAGIARQSRRPPHSGGSPHVRSRSGRWAGGAPVPSEAVDDAMAIAASQWRCADQPVAGRFDNAAGPVGGASAAPPPRSVARAAPYTGRGSRDQA